MLQYHLKTKVIVPPSQPIAVSVALSVPQTVVLLVDIVGAPGLTPASIFMIFDETLVPQVFLHFAVYVPTPTKINSPVVPLLHSTVVKQP